MQYDFVIALLKECKNLEIHTCIDTTGNINSDKLVNVASLTNLFLYDLKLLDDNEDFEAEKNAWKIAKYINEAVNKEKEILEWKAWVLSNNKRYKK